MSDRRVLFDGVWKKFRRGERHDSLRDLLPATFRRWTSRKSVDDLEGEEFWAVKDVTFEVSRGEALGIIGPNGAGKSTALKLLTRILRPTKGRCEVRGRVGALIEVAAGFHPDLTGRENIFLQGSIMGMKHAEIARRFDDIVDFSGVSAFIDTPVKRYSSGMQARLGFSVAAHLEPDVLFVDEVLSVGDISFQGRCLEKMRHQIRQGVTVIFVSHNLPAVASLCNRVLVIVQGERKFDGDPTAAVEAYLQSAPGGSTAYGALQNFAVRSASLKSLDGTTDGSATLRIQPHARCRLVATIECLTDTPPCSIGVSIDRSADLFYCYGAASEEMGVPLFSARAGDCLKITLDFVAHFARGHYRLNLNVRDPRAAVFHLFAENVGTFVVDDDITYAGITEIEPQITVTRGVVEDSYAQLSN